MGYDIILMQETFLLQNRLAGAVRGYFSSFILARGTAGRPGLTPAPSPFLIGRLGWDRICLLLRPSPKPFKIGFWLGMPAELKHGRSLGRPTSLRCGNKPPSSSTNGPSAWSTSTITKIIKRCPAGKARGADRWGMSEFKLLPPAAVLDLAQFLKTVELTGVWPEQLREMLYLQLPKDGAHEAGQRRPIALLPQVYRLWSATCKHDVKQWRQRCRARGEVPVGEGALDETFDLAFKTEARNASCQHQGGVFLDCSKCYERVPLAQLEQFAIEHGFPFYALNCALNMYSGSRRILIQGAVSESVQSTCGLPPGCWTGC
eukprot:5913580-Amphidinium_carterae.1